MDGEISRETGRFLVRRLGADKELCATWARYHLVRDCLRHQDGGLASEGLSSRVQRVLERESAPSPARRITAKWLKPAAGLAVAASVALMAIVAVAPGRQTGETSPADSGEMAAVESFTSPQGLTPVTVSRQASLSGGIGSDNRMNPYLLRHYQATGSTNGKGFVTFVPIVITSEAQSEDSPDDAPGQDPEAEEVAQTQ